MKRLTGAERLCATLLFYFSSGLHARTVFDEGGSDVGVRAPTEEDLLGVMNTTPMATWTSALSFAETLVRQIIEDEPRDALTVFKEAALTIRRGKEALESFVAPGDRRPMHEVIVDTFPPRKKGAR